MSEEVQQQIDHLNRKVEQLCEQSRYEEAIELVIEGHDLALQAHDYDSYWRFWNMLPELYIYTGDYARAEPLLRGDLEMCGIRFGKMDPAYASRLDKLGSLYCAMGKYGKAKRSLRRALKIRREICGEVHQDVADSLNSLGLLYRAMGDHVAAKEHYEQALEIYCAVLGEEHLKVATCSNNLGVVYYAMGDYAAAERLYRKALKIRRDALGDEHPDVVACLNNLVALYHSMGNDAAKDRLLDQLDRVLRSGGGKKLYSSATMLSNLAVLRSPADASGEAEQLLVEAAERDRELLGDKHPEYATDLNNLGMLYFSKRNFERAEPLLQQALAIRRAALGDEHPATANSLHNLGVLYGSMGEYARAEPLYQRALAIFRAVLGEEHPDVSLTLQNLAALCVATKRYAQAMAFMQEAVAVDSRMIGRVFAGCSESQRMAFLRTLQRSFAAYLTLVRWHFSDSLEKVQDSLDLVLRRKALAAEALAAQRDAVLGGRYPSLSPSLQELARLRTQIAQKTLSGPGPEGAIAHRQLLEEWVTRKEELEADLARQIPEMSLTQRLERAGRDEVAKAISPGAVLIELVRYDGFSFTFGWLSARYLAFVLPAGALEELQMVDLGQAEPIDEMIAGFRAAHTGSGRDAKRVQPQIAAGMSDGTELRKAVFDPLVAAFGDRKRLLFAPDGDLLQLPFEALPMDDGRHPIDEYRISYLSTGRDLLRFGAASAVQSNAPLVAADPDFDLGSGLANTAGVDEGPGGRQSRDLDRGSLRFERLPGTRREGEQVAALLNVEPWLEGAALEARLKACQSPRILHIATHGFFLPDQERDPSGELPEEQPIGGQGSGQRAELLRQGLENPLLRSGLALAGANTWLQEKPLPAEAEDGLLTAEDVSGLDLLATELVVLSACDTGLGEVRVGEGVFGLRRAFVLAGARTLVMSLWKVPDKETQELMVDFYQRLLRGEPRAEALRGAQLAMKKKHHDPFCWGAFICQGDPGPLPLLGSVPYGCTS
jgi:CHAT domain-containing protein/Tfp pilus assembly protein PilF